MARPDQVPDGEDADEGRGRTASGGDERLGRTETGSVTVRVSGRTVTVGLPPDADETEAAAIATAVGAHLHDRSRAAATAGQGAGDVERTDQWTLATRMKAVGKRRWPEDVRRGEEWNAAARSFD
jgi:hypothetical protein